LNEVKKLFQYAHSIGLVSTNLLTFPMLVLKKSQLRIRTYRSNGLFRIQSWLDCERIL